MQVDMTDVMVECPALNAAVNVEETCTRCRFFASVLCTNTSEAIPWKDRHQIVCQYPRRLVTIVVAETQDAINEIESRAAARVVKRG